MRRFFIILLTLFLLPSLLPQPSLASSCQCFSLNQYLPSFKTPKCTVIPVADTDSSACLNGTYGGGPLVSRCNFCTDNVCQIGCNGADTSLLQISKSCTQESDCQVSPCPNGRSLCKQGQCFVNQNLKQCWDNTNSYFGQKIEFKAPVLEIRIPGVSFSPDPLTVDNKGFLTVPYLVDYIKAIYKFLAIAASIVAAIVIIMGGFQITMSAGGEAKGEGIKRVGQAITGLFIMWSSYAILYTVNPRLTQLTPIRVKYITPVVDDLEFDVVNTEERTIDNTSIVPTVSKGKLKVASADLEILFKTYGDCLNENWVALRELARVESNLDPKAINPKSQFAGLFQTKTKYANDFAKGYGINFGNPADFESNPSGGITNPQLLNAENSTIVGTAIYLNSARIINKYCDLTSMTPEDYFYFIYVGHQSGPGAFNYVLNTMKNANGGQCNAVLSPKYVEEYYTKKPKGRPAAEIAAESDKGGKKYAGLVVSALGGGKLDWKSVKRVEDPNFVCPLQ